MKIKLSSLAKIRTGHTFRGKVENIPHGNCFVIQPRDISLSNTDFVEIPNKTLIDRVPTHQLLEQGDILLLAKGNRNFAWLYNRSEKAIASSLFFVLRPDNSKITSSYLTWYLNQEATQSVLSSAQAGTSVANLSLSDLGELVIKVPSIITQNKLVNLYKLWQIEKSKTISLISQKDKYFNNLVLDEIEREFEVPPFTDEYGQWIGYWMLSNYNIADITFRESVYVKGEDEPVKQLHSIIMGIDTYSREVDLGGGSKRWYNAVKDWRLVEFRNLREYNNSTLPAKERDEKYLNIVPHCFIQGIVMRDRFGNVVTE